MQAIILVGGFGTRLQSVVKDLPKPMAPIGDKPFLALLIESFRRRGVKEIMLSVHHMREAIQEYFGNNYNGMKISYAIEETPLGTGGAIVNSMNILQPKNPVLVVNGDTFLKIDLSRMYQIHKDKKAGISIALRQVESCKRFGEVVVEDGIIKDFAYAGNDGAGYINAGIYVINANFFKDYKLNKSFSFERDFLYQYTPKIKPLAYISEDYFIDIGIPEDYERACNELPNIINAY